MASAHIDPELAELLVELDREGAALEKGGPASGSTTGNTAGGGKGGAGGISKGGAGSMSEGVSRKFLMTTRYSGTEIRSHPGRGCRGFLVTLQPCNCNR
jgi:membrane protein involved in colicin uptake